MLNFELLKTDPASHARRGRLTLNHGVVQTPIFMPVGTYGTVKGVMPRSLHDMGAQIILGNTFHLWMRPGLDIMQQLRRAARIREVAQAHPDATRAASRSGRWAPCARSPKKACALPRPVNGDKLFLTPEISMQIQTIAELGHRHAVRRVHAVLEGDQARPHHHRDRSPRKSMEMSLRWAKRCSDRVRRAWRTPTPCSASCKAACSRTCARSRWPAWSTWTCPGYAVGGVSVGEPKDEMLRIMAHITPHRLPANKPRYLMGVGTPRRPGGRAWPRAWTCSTA